MSENNERGVAAFELESQESSIPGFERQADKEPKQDRGDRGDRGFAAMDPSLQKEIARKGGAAVSKDREHMASIGRKGGEAVSKNREHMSAIGRKGGKAGGETRTGAGR